MANVGDLVCFEEGIAPPSYKVSDDNNRQPSNRFHEVMVWITRVVVRVEAGLGIMLCSFLYFDIVIQSREGKLT